MEEVPADIASAEVDHRSTVPAVRHTAEAAHRTAGAERRSKPAGEPGAGRSNSAPTLLIAFLIALFDFAM